MDNTPQRAPRIGQDEAALLISLFIVAIGEGNPVQMAITDDLLTRALTGQPINGITAHCPICLQLSLAHFAGMCWTCAQMLKETLVIKEETP